MEITKLSSEVIQRAKENKFKFSDGLYGIDDTKLKEIATTYIDNHKVIEKQDMKIRNTEETVRLDSIGLKKAKPENLRLKSERLASPIT